MNPILHRIELLSSAGITGVSKIHVESVDREHYNEWMLEITHADGSRSFALLTAKRYDIDAWISEVAQVGAAPDYTSDADGERIWFDTKPTLWMKVKAHA